MLAANASAHIRNPVFYRACWARRSPRGLLAQFRSRHGNPITWQNHQVCRSSFHTHSFPFVTSWCTVTVAQEGFRRNQPPLRWPAPYRVRMTVRLPVMSPKSFALAECTHSSTVRWDAPMDPGRLLHSLSFRRIALINAIVDPDSRICVWKTRNARRRDASQSSFGAAKTETW